jgi:hypothetical protein
MGRFSWLVLGLLAACGDNTISSGDEPDDDFQPTGEVGVVAPRYVPTVCDATSWTTNIGGDLATNVSVVAGRSNGATLLAVPVGGGAMTGFVLDPSMNMLSGGQKIDTKQAFEDVSVTRTEDLVIATAVSNGSVYTYLLDTKLGSPQLAAKKLPGTHLAEPAFFYTSHDLVMPVGGDDGLTLHRFSSSYNYIDSKHVVATPPATGLTSAQVGLTTMAAWSTKDDCYLTEMMAYDAAPSINLGYACSSPRLAVNAATQAGALVFDSPEGVRLLNTQYASKVKAGLLRAGGSSPRILFDGMKFWVSFLDPRGDVNVGFLDERNQLISVSIAGARPQSQAYEFALVKGELWVFALDASGYSAYRMCVDAVDPRR